MTDLAPLRRLPELTHLRIDFAHAKDLSPLGELKKLRKLALLRAPTADIKSLKALTALEELNLRYTQVRDLAPIAALAKLSVLNLSHTPVADLSALKKLVQLESLDLLSTKAHDLAPLKALTKLKRLILPELTSDLSALRNLTNLEVLLIARSQVRDLSPMQELTKLKSLTVMYTEVSDISPLERLRSLNALTLLQTNVRDLSALKNLTRLKELSLRDTPVRSLSGIEGLKVLTRLDLTRTRVANLTPLSNLTELTWLGLGETLVRSLRPLRQLTKLREIDISSTAVADLTPLMGIRALQRLYLHRTKVSDLSPLKKLTGLSALTIDFTKVSDLSPLVALTNLRQFSANGTKISRARFHSLQKALPRLEKRRVFTDKRLVHFSKLGPFKMSGTYGVWAYGVSGTVTLPETPYDSSYPDVQIAEPFSAYGHGRELPFVIKEDWRVQDDPSLEIKRHAPVHRIWYRRKNETCGMRIGMDRTLAITVVDVPCNKVHLTRIHHRAPCPKLKRRNKWHRYKMLSPFAGESIELHPANQGGKSLSLNVISAFPDGPPREWQIYGRQIKQGLEVEISTAYVTVRGVVGAKQRGLFQRTGPMIGLGCARKGTGGFRSGIVPRVAYHLKLGAKIFYDARLKIPVATVTKGIFFMGTRLDLTKLGLTKPAPKRRSTIRIDSWIGKSGLCREYIRDRCRVNLFVSPSDAISKSTTK